MTTIGCVITAAGRGERLGGDLPKALQTVAGETLLTHATRLMASAPDVTAVVVAAPADHLAAARRAVADISGPQVTVVAGGATRTESVRSAVGHLPAGVTGILVHDAARPFVPPAVVTAVIAALAAGADGAVPGLPVVDTIKQVDAADVVVATPERALLRAVQTPQGFQAPLLREALADTGAEATDDSQLVERLGAAVRVVPGHPDGMKVTTPGDLVRAEEILQARRAHAD